MSKPQTNLPVEPAVLAEFLAALEREKLIRINRRKLKLKQ
jgi:hypothetical protein